MPSSSDVHAVGTYGDADGVLPPSRPTVTVPTSVAGTEAAGQPATFSDASYFYARCRPTDAVGACVYANSTLAFVSTASATQPDPVVGVIVAKASATDCTVQRYGQSSIAYANLAQGTRYFLNNDGGVIAPPFPQNTVEFVQQVGNAVSANRLFIQPTGTVIRRDVSGDYDMANCGCLLNGVGAPAASLGSANAFYIDTSTDEMYGPYSDANGWGAPVSLVGQVGPPGQVGATGPAGQDGVDGASTLTGQQPPSDAAGKDGDTYIQLDPNGEAIVFWGQRTGGHWPASGTSMVGPPGAPAPAPIGGDGPPDEANVGPAGQLYLDRQNVAIYQAQA